jgi:DNA-binding SARP family transcriptional activator/Tfp pilus assembly protein PilF
MHVFQVLGPVRAWSGGEEIDLGSPQQKAVLAALLLQADRPVAMYQLQDALWGESPPASGSQTIRTYIYRLRNLLVLPAGAATVIHTADDGYLIRLPAADLDLTVFRQHVRAADGARTAGDRQQALEDLRQGLALWRGQPLAGIPGPLAEAQRNLLGRQRLNALQTALTLEVELGHLNVAGELAEIAAENPLDERFRVLLMLALYRSGRQAEALQVFQETQALLGEQLGIDPGPQLQALYLQILRADPDLLGSATQTQSDADPAAAEPPPAPDFTSFPPAQLPLGPATFTGRTKELRRLDGLLPAAGQSAANTVITTVHGMAGVGKTALALHWAHRVAARFPDGQVYLNLRGFDPSGAALEPGEALRILFDAFAVPAGQIPVGLQAQTAFLRTLLSRRRVLIVLDNARDAEQVRPLLPGTTGCTVIITSRTQLTRLVALEHAVPVALDVLAPDGARALLAERLGITHPQSSSDGSAAVAADRAVTDDALTDVIELCGGLPLALSVVAARAVLNPDTPLRAIAAALRAVQGTLDGFADQDPSIDVRAIFSWSYRQLTPPAARLFRLIALHPAPDLSVAAAASLGGLAPARTESLLRDLARAHLELTLADDPQRAATLTRMIEHYLYTAHAAAQLLGPSHPLPELGPPDPLVLVATFTGTTQANDWLVRERTSITAAIAIAGPIGAQARGEQLAATVSDAFHRHGHWADQVRTQMLALEYSRRLQNPRGEAAAYRSLGRVYARLNEPQQAQASLDQALRILTEIGDLNGQARVHRTRAYLHDRNGELELSRQSIFRAVELSRQEGDETQLANALGHYGWINAVIGDYDTAGPYCEEALAIARRTGNRIGEAGAWDSLGYIRHHQGDHEQAAQCYQDSLQIFREQGDREHQAEVLIHHADLNRDLGRIGTAVGYLTEAAQIQDDLKHPSAEKTRLKLEELTRS